MSEHTGFYLMSLLSHFADSSIPDQPLGPQLFTKTEPSERIIALKEIGDTSLFVSGFFNKNMKYYYTIGATAYDELSFKFKASSLHGVYKDLCRRFVEFMKLLSEIKTQCKNDMHLWKLI